MRVLVVGSGGREHALAWKLAASPRVSEVVAAPGNPGMRAVARLVPTSLEPRRLLELARAERPELVVIGPEAPLVAGAADLLRGQGLAVFGPGGAAARLEGSKRFAKEFMRRHGIPTAEHAAFADHGQALRHLHGLAAPPVVKDSRLAAGKGVTVAESLEEAERALAAIFADGAGEVVLEERLTGQELSLLVLTDGHAHSVLPLAQDYKQALDGDLGPMTGGMGAVAPAPLLGAAGLAELERTVVEPTLAGLRSEGIDYRGVLYFGLMLTERGPQVLEYNVRFGDPETQAVLPLLESDLAELLLAVAEGRLAGAEPAWADRAAACVVMAAPGYPGEYRQGIPVTGFAPTGDLLLFHAGTAERGGHLLSSGGRVLNVVATAPSLSAAVARAYDGVARVDFPGAHYRRDIGARLLPR